MGDVVTWEIRLKKGLVLAQFGADISAGQGVRVVIGMGEDIPPRRPQGLQGGPIHIIVSAPGSPSPIGPGSHNRRTCPPA